MEVKKICGIFAVATMVVSTFFVTSCNSEDDFDFGPDSQYSLAERNMTRANENLQEPEIKKTIKIKAEFEFDIYKPNGYYYKSIDEIGYYEINICTDEDRSYINGSITEDFSYPINYNLRIVDCIVNYSTTGNFYLITIKAAYEDHECKYSNYDIKLSTFQTEKNV